MSKENKFKLLYEYYTLSQTDNKGKMQGEPQKGPTRMSLHDIVKTHKEDNQNPPDKPSRNDVLPAPLTKNHLSVLADMYASAASLSVDVQKAKENPVIKSNKQKEAIDNIFNKMKDVIDIIKNLEDDFSNLGRAS